MYIASAKNKGPVMQKAGGDRFLEDYDIGWVSHKTGGNSGGNNGGGNNGGGNSGGGVNNRVSNVRRNNAQKFGLLEDNLGDMEMIDTRKIVSYTNKEIFEEELPNKIQGTYNEDYNILYIDEIIRKKLQQEKYGHLTYLKNQYSTLEKEIMQPQTYIMREKSLSMMDSIKQEIEQIETGARIKIYNEKVKDIIINYKKYSGQIKTVIFDVEEKEHYEEINSDVRYRLSYIDKFLDIASEYIQLDIIRINNRPTNICIGCGFSLSKIATNEEGTQRCPECHTEHNVIITAKLAKDGARINTNNSSEDESIDNFLRAFIRYQGLQTDIPPDSLYEELDEYFQRHGRPCGEEIRQLPINNRGRKGDTNHKMIWSALSQIGRAEYYEDANLIGHIYWGWMLPNVMHLRERIIDKYNKTQKGFYQIPAEERCRTSSLGTQYRLWRHLQLEGHECYIDEFKIAENPESLRIHNKLWRLMCEAANDPEIYYIP